MAAGNRGAWASREASLPPQPAARRSRPRPVVEVSTTAQPFQPTNHLAGTAVFLRDFCGSMVGNIGEFLHGLASHLSNIVLCA